MIVVRCRSLLFAFLLLAATGCGKKKPDADGARVFATYCSRCHGEHGEGGQGDAGGPVPRRLADPALFADRTEEQVTLTVLDGKGNAMPAFRGTLTEAEARAVVAYVRALGKP